MSDNALVPLDKEAAIAAFNGDDNPFTQDAAEHGVTDAGRLSFSGNTGNWKAGNDPVEAGSQYVFNCMEASRGWMAWKNNKPVAYHWASVVKREKLPDVSELADHWEGVPKGKRPKETDGWSYVVRIPVRDLVGGPQLEITLPGEPSYRPINKLLLAYGQNMKFHLDPNTKRYKMPIVEIDSESFDGKGGTKYAPILTIVDWISEDEMIRLASEVATPATTKGPDSDTGKAIPLEATTVKDEPKAAPAFRRQRVG